MEEVRQDRNGGCGARRDADGTNLVLAAQAHEKTLHGASKKKFWSCTRNRNSIVIRRPITRCAPGRCS